MASLNKVTSPKRSIQFSVADLEKIAAESPSYTDALRELLAPFKLADLDEACGLVHERTGWTIGYVDNLMAPDFWKALHRLVKYERTQKTPAAPAPEVREPLCIKGVEQKPGEAPDAFLKRVAQKLKATPRFRAQLRKDISRALVAIADNLEEDERLTAVARWLDRDGVQPPKRWGPQHRVTPFEAICDRGGNLKARLAVEISKVYTILHRARII